MKRGMRDVRRHDRKKNHGGYHRESGFNYHWGLFAEEDRYGAHKAPDPGQAN